MELNDTHNRYLLAIYQLTLSKSDVSSKDIANRLSISKASVTKMMSILMEKNLVDKERYGKIHLTDVGYSLAEHLAEQTDTLARTLQSQIALTDEEAKKAACAAVCELPSHCFLSDAVTENK